MPDRSPSDPNRSTHEDFIRSRPAEGALLAPDNRRVTALPEGLMQELHRGLTGASAAATQQLLYLAGYEWGLQEMLQLSQRLRDEANDPGSRELWRMDVSFVLERWSAPFAAAGWGACIFDLSSREKGVAFVELRQSASAAAVDQATAPVCHLYAGLFAGALSFYDRVESHAVEIECAALGQSCCRFVVGPGPLIDQVENARHSGATPEAIRRLVVESRPASATTTSAAATTAPAKAAKIPWKK